MELSYIARLHSFDEIFKGGPNLGINGVKVNFYEKGEGNIDTQYLECTGKEPAFR